MYILPKYPTEIGMVCSSEHAYYGLGSEAIGFNCRTKKIQFFFSKAKQSLCSGSLIEHVAEFALDIEVLEIGA